MEKTRYKLLIIESMQWRSKTNAGIERKHRVTAQTHEGRTEVHIINDGGYTDQVHVLQTYFGKIVPRVAETVVYIETKHVSKRKELQALNNIVGVRIEN